MNNNWDILGHEWAVELLKGHLKTDAPRHAYLFTGPQGVGRRTLALRFAQAINAISPSEPGAFDPQEKSSQQFERMQHPDLSVVRVEEGDRDIKIGAIRALQQFVALSPYIARHRIALLLNFETASPGASNALLKTLEEPPGSLVLMLTAQNVEALLPTIVSRCEIVRLRPVRLTQLEEGLQEQFGIPQDQAMLLAHISGGRPGYALHLFRNPEVLEQRESWLNEQYGLLSANRVARFSYAAGLAKDKEHFANLLQVWLSYWRDVLLHATGAQTPLANLDRKGEIEQLAGRVGLPAAQKTVTLIERTSGLLRANVNLRLAAEILLLDIPKI